MSHTDALIEGEIESPSWDLGGVSRIKFSAPFRKMTAKSNAEPTVCCLK